MQEKRIPELSARRMARWWREVAREASKKFQNPLMEEELDQFEMHLSGLIEDQDPRDLQMRVDYGRISSVLIDALNRAGITQDPRFLFFNKTQMVIRPIRTHITAIIRESYAFTQKFSVHVEKARYDGQFREEWHDLFQFEVN